MTRNSVEPEDDVPSEDVQEIRRGNTRTIRRRENVRNEPNRARRTWYIYILSVVLYFTILLLAYTGTTKIAELVVDGMLSLLMVVVVTYVTAYSVDSSEILKRLGHRKGISSSTTEKVEDHDS